MRDQQRENSSGSPHNDDPPRDSSKRLPTEARPETVPPRIAPAQRRLVSEDRRRLAKAMLVVILFAALIIVLRTWHGRALDVVLVHRFPSGDPLLPASVQVMVWEDDLLYADAYFPDPRSLAELEHLVRVPKGEYRVTFTLQRTFGHIDVRFERALTVEGEGRYYLTYDDID